MRLDVWRHTFFITRIFEILSTPFGALLIWNRCVSGPGLKHTEQTNMQTKLFKGHLLMCISSKPQARLVYMYISEPDTFAALFAVVGHFHHPASAEQIRKVLSFPLRQLLLIAVEFAQNPKDLLANLHSFLWQLDTRQHALPVCLFRKAT